MKVTYNPSAWKWLTFGVAVLITVIVFGFAACVGTPPPAPEPAPQPEPAAAPPPPPPPPPPAVPQPLRTTLILDGASNHTVKSGETLAEIAKQYYNNGHYYPVIHLANSHVIQDPDRIDPGTQLVIPDLHTNLNDSGARGVVKQSLTDSVPFEHSRSRSDTTNGIRELSDSL
jgi:Tfp pilus assembly protein FimV